jgi:hypothetical protein
MVFDHLSLLNDDSPPSSAESASSQADSPPDWSQFSSLWDSDRNTFQPTNAKFDPASFDFALNLPLDMDLNFDPSLAVDPTALHFNPNMFAASDLSSFPSQQLAFPQSLTPRRMSITSSSSSGASFSPVLDPTIASSIPSIPSTTAASPNLSSVTHVPVNTTMNDSVADLAQSVCQAAGVTLAVPVQGQAEQLAFSRMDLVARLDPMLSNSHELDAPKLPIPRLQRPSPATSTGSKRKSSVAELNSSLDPSLGGTVAIIGRPKTSHTTIERRYRTNLNARIQSLKDAVPALRVLENKEKVKKAQDSPEAELEEKLAWNDLVDERGFVDGVKVARKISKANVLGKATEYIQ